MTPSSPRQLLQDSLVIATHNPGKLHEMSAMLADYAIECLSAGNLGLAEPEETGTTYIANARLKAVAAATASGMPALADDSGFEVMAINHAPGLFSARWAGPQKDFSMAMEKVHEAVLASGNDDRRACFVCALSLAWPDGHDETVEGKITGHFTWPPRGDKGFGYDPVFIPEGSSLTFGESDQDWKHSISHRAVAFAALQSRCLVAAKLRH